MSDLIRLHQSDSVAVAAREIAAGESLDLDGVTVVASQDIPRGHKIALRDIAADEDVIKYGYPIGHATANISAGSWIHSHNLATNLGANLSYAYAPTPIPEQPTASSRTFRGYRRANGQVGIRNDLFIVPTVGCINGQLDGIARDFEIAHGGQHSFDSVIVTRHPYGCSQLGGDLDATREVLSDVIRHPNAGGVLVVGLGCENNQMSELRAGLGAVDETRVKFLVSQEVDDEKAAAADLLEQLNAAAAADQRVDVPVGELRVGLKCGGSDGFSGITANPMFGRFADWLIAQGGSAVLTEVPEMFGAEQLLMARAQDESVFGNIVTLINNFKDYFKRYDQPIYENPSPGNKAGGITTLEEKSLGCTQKSGSSAVVDVLSYGERLRKRGLSLLQAPGNDLVSSSAEASAGCHMVLFSTGRGTPFGTYVPTVKVSTNSELAQRKPNWIDFDAGRLFRENPDVVRSQFIDFIIDVASGVSTNNEKNHVQEIAIFKDGVTE